MKYKYNGQWVDVNIKALDSMEIGCVIAFAGDTIPTGWLVCDGSSITQSAYPELYALIGGTLPNFKGRTLVGKDSTDTDFDTLLETGGSKELQEHHHRLGLNNQGGSETLGISWTSNGGGALYDNTALCETAGTGHSGNLQPYAVINWIIKAKNTTPTMASIVNDYSESTTDGYSCDYVNGINTYSTDAIRIGTYANGKPIYRKIITGTTTTSGSQSTHLIDSNLQQPLKVDGFVDIGGGTFIPLAYSNMGAPDFYFVDNGNLKVQVGNSGFANKSFYAIIEYTKTTD